MVLTPASFVYMYDGETDTLELICRKDEFIEYYGGLLGVESHGKFSWMVHQKGVMRCYDHEKKRFVKQVDFLEGQLKPDDRVIMKILDNGDFWVMWDRGVGYYDVFTRNGIRYRIFSWDIIHGLRRWMWTKEEMPGLERFKMDFM